MATLHERAYPTAVATSILNVLVGEMKFKISTSQDSFDKYSALYRSIWSLSKQTGSSASAGSL